jgi:hypothetical protein
MYLEERISVYETKWRKIFKKENSIQRQELTEEVEQIQGQQTISLELREENDG